MSIKHLHVGELHTTLVEINLESVSDKREQTFE